MLCDPAAFWQTFGTYEGERIHLDDWQVAHLRDYARYRAREKAPQIGFSWLSALEATWDCLLHLDATNGFVSVDQREAGEKILYSKKAYSELPDVFHSWVPLVKDSSDELWFGAGERPSRLMSIPATSALRGRRMSVYLDEVDFYRDGGKDAHRIALGRITRGGRMTMGSTCFGVDTQLDKTMSKEGKNFSKGRFPWTVAENPDVIAAVKIAQDELDEDDFAEEYECVRGGSASDSFPATLIRSSQHDRLLVSRDELESRAPLMGSYDVGATRHPSMLSVFENAGDTWQQIVLEEIRGLSLPEQETLVGDLLTRLTNLSIVIDAQGLGMHIAQSLQARFGERVIFMQPGSKPPNMPPQDRGAMAIELRRAMEADEVQIAVDKNLSQQLRRTRIVKGTGGKVLVEQPGSKKKTHYDAFWTTAYGVYGIGAGRRESVYERRGLIVIGAT